ncbi:MAG: DUF481 domain-containing protein [Vicinamibacterales bacterium]
MPVHRFPHRFIVSGVLLALVLGLPARLWAQDIDALPELVEDMQAAPRPGQSGASITLGATMKQGRTETLGWSVSGWGAHTTKKRELLRLDVGLQYADYKATPQSDSITVEDNQQVLFTYIRPLNLRWSLLGIGQYKRDAILDLNYRAAAEGGIGYNLIETGRIFAQVGGSFALGKEDRGHTELGDQVRDVGILQLFTYHITPVLGFEEYFKAHVDTSATDDHHWELSATLLSQVSKSVGLKIYYTHQYDALHSPENGPTQKELGVGVQITLKKADAGSSKP